MASADAKNLCAKCSKGTAQAICGGCEKWFCRKHLLEHHQELSQQMDELILEYDQIQHGFRHDHHDERNSLIMRIDQWEKRSIDRIRQVADDARRDVNCSIHRIKSQTQRTLRQLKNELRENRQTENYTEIELNIWLNRLRELRQQLNQSSMIDILHEQEDISTNVSLIQLRQNIQISDNFFQINDKTLWKRDGQTVAGGHGSDNGLNQLEYPYGLDVDDDGTLFIADDFNHRIMRWEADAIKGNIVAGGRGKGKRMDQLCQPYVVLFNRINENLIISDYGNRRIIQFPLETTADRCGTVLLFDIVCLGLAMDNEGALYVSDFERGQVRRYRPGATKGQIVAGGNNQGSHLDQLNCPRNIFVDDEHSVYVSEMFNNRVVKWLSNAKQGIVVAGGHGLGSTTKHLNRPSGIWVDSTGAVYVVDQENHRVMRWSKNAQEGEIIFGGNGEGSRADQFRSPASISIDQDGHLYVADRNNHRIQKFDRI